MDNDYLAVLDFSCGSVPSGAMRVKDNSLVYGKLVVRAIEKPEGTFFYALPPLGKSLLHECPVSPEEEGEPIVSESVAVAHSRLTKSEEEKERIREENRVLHAVISQKDRQIAMLLEINQRAQDALVSLLQQLSGRKDGDEKE